MFKKVIKIFSNTVLTILVLFMLALATSFLPLPGNFKAFVVQSGSMEPTVKTGSLVFVKPSKTYAIGDIINIKDGKSSITHRVVSKKIENGIEVFETKGDANEEADAQLVPQDRIFGKMFWGLPYIGYPVGYAKTQKGFLFLVIIPCVIIIYEELRKIKEEIARVIFKKKPENNLLAVKTENLQEAKMNCRPKKKVKNDFVNLGIIDLRKM